MTRLHTIANPVGNHRFEQIRMGEMTASTRSEEGSKQQQSEDRSWRRPKSCASKNIVHMVFSWSMQIRSP
jgi:hypothetical protein